MRELLTIDKLEVAYGECQALRGISVSVEAGEILGIVGESGSGKSTLIYAILRLLGQNGRVSGGRILYEGTDLAEVSEEEMRRLRGRAISLIAQDPMRAFHPARKIGSQLKELVKAHKDLSWAEAKERFSEALGNMGLEDSERILGSYAFELSGGMCQRVCIAMSMVFRPGLLLADEPTSALDVVVQRQVIDELQNIRKAYGTSILIVSHNIGVISCMADHVAVMCDGRIVEYGEKEQVIRNPQDAYTRKLIASVPSLKRPLHRREDQR